MGSGVISSAMRAILLYLAGQPGNEIDRASEGEVRARPCPHRLLAPNEKERSAAMLSFCGN